MDWGFWDQVGFGVIPRGFGGFGVSVDAQAEEKEMVWGWIWMGMLGKAPGKLGETGKRTQETLRAPQHRKARGKNPGIWVGNGSSQNHLIPTHLSGHRPPLDPSGAGDQDVVSDQKIPRDRQPLPAPVGAGRPLLPFGRRFQGKRREKLAPESGSQVFQGGQVLVHHVPLRQLPGGHRVPLEVPQEAAEDVLHPEARQEVVLLDLAAEGARDAVLEAAKKRREKPQKSLGKLSESPWKTLRKTLE